MAFFFALVISGVAFLVGALVVGLSDEGGNAVALSITGGAFILIGPTAVAAAALLRRVDDRNRRRARRSGLRIAISDAWVIQPTSPDIPLIVAGNAVPRLVRTVVVLWNAGSLTIHNQDGLYAQPICFQMPGNLLDHPHMLCGRGEGIRFLQGQSNDVVAQFDLLRAGDGAAAEIVHDGPDWRATVSPPWDGLEPRLRLWPIILIGIFSLGIAVEVIHGLFDLPRWALISLGVVLLVAVARNFGRLVCLWGVAFNSPLGSQADIDETDLWLRRVPRYLRDTRSGNYTSPPSTRRT